MDEGPLNHSSFHKNFFSISKQNASTRFILCNLDVETNFQRLKNAITLEMLLHFIEEWTVPLLENILKKVKLDFLKKRVVIKNENPLY